MPHLDRKEKKRFYDVAYDDGETETRIPSKQIQRRQGPPEKRAPLLVGEEVKVKSEKRMRKEKALKIAKINRERNAKRYAKKRKSLDRGPKTLADRQRAAQEREEGKGCCGKFLKALGLGGAPAEKAGPESPYARRERSKAPARGAEEEEAGAPRGRWPRRSRRSTRKK